MSRIVRTILSVYGWLVLVVHGRVVPARVVPARVVPARVVPARVVKVLRNRMNIVVNSVYTRRRVLLDIPNADGTTYQAVLPMLCEIGTSPDPGDKLQLRIDPANPQHFTLATSAQTDGQTDGQTDQ